MISRPPEYRLRNRRPPSCDLGLGRVSPGPLPPLGIPGAGISTPSKGFTGVENPHIDDALKMPTEMADCRRRKISRVSADGHPGALSIQFQYFQNADGVSVAF